MNKNFIFVFFLFAIGVAAQESGSISGKILDSENLGEPLIFAQVNLKDTDISAETNFHGNFNFDRLAPGEYILIVQYAGYETKEIPVIIEDQKTSTVFEELQTRSLDMIPYKELKAASSADISRAPGQ